MGKIMGYIISCLSFFITIVFLVNKLATKQWEIYSNWLLFTVFVFPALLYSFYYFSNGNKLLSFFIAFFNDWICWGVAVFAYHYDTDFELWNDGETQLVEYLMIDIKLLITIIAGIVYILKALFKRVKLRNLNTLRNNNCNNYLYGQRMDYNNTHLFFIHKKFVFSYISKTSNKKLNHLKILNTKFQIEDHKVYYYHKGNLIESTEVFAQRKIVVSGILKFLVIQNGIYYTKRNKNGGETLFYKSETVEEKEICKDSIWFCRYKNGVLILKEKERSNTEYDIIEVNPQNCKEKHIALLQSKSILHKAYLAGEMIVFIDGDKVVRSFSMKTQEQQLLFKTPLGEYNINLICDEKFIYLSNQAIERTGSAIYELKNSKNGLYKIDIQTGQHSKLNDKTCDELYLFGGYIFGYKLNASGNRLFQISESGELCSEIS